ncbi:MAG: SoxR reducing system RseC family protein [Nitrospirae bacterium]|nr:SoxR reducing system RseC family protein [Nitrospirota bacterium]
MVKFPMIEEIGTVLSVEGLHARVSVPKKSSCQGCSSGTCVAGDQSMEIEAINKAGAVVGQQVKVLVHTSAYMKGSMVIYGFPALMLVIGAVIGKEVMPRFFSSADADSLSAIFGFSFLVASFIFIKIWSAAQPGKTATSPVIEEILKEHTSD